jgi:hypothetical protein
MSRNMPSRFAPGLPTVSPEALDRMASDRGAECPYCGFPAGLKSVVCDRCRELATRAVQGDRAALFRLSVLAHTAD